jgi:AcrR family transcriptional regulator
MPKLIDWGVRFELIREAVMRVAARDGGAAVTVDSVAAELNVSGSTLRRTLASSDVLPYLGVEWIVRLRRYAWFNQEAAVERGTLERAVRAVRSELPRDAEDLDRERAWAALTVVGSSDRVAKVRADYHEHLDELVTRVVARLEPDEERREFEARRLRALMDGLVAAACRSDLTTEQMLGVFDRHMSELMERAPDPISPDAAESPR